MSGLRQLICACYLHCAPHLPEGLIERTLPFHMRPADACGPQMQRFGQIVSAYLSKRAADDADRRAPIDRGKRPHRIDPYEMAGPVDRVGATDDLELVTKGTSQGGFGELAGIARHQGDAHARPFLAQPHDGGSQLGDLGLLVDIAEGHHLRFEFRWCRIG